MSQIPGLDFIPVTFGMLKVGEYFSFYSNAPGKPVIFKKTSARKYRSVGAGYGVVYQTGSKTAVEVVK